MAITLNQAATDVETDVNLAAVAIVAIDVDVATDAVVVDLTSAVDLAEDSGNILNNTLERELKDFYSSSSLFLLNYSS